MLSSLPFKAMLSTHRLCAWTGLLLLGLGACSSSLQPRTDQPIPFEKYRDLGAVVDASRGFPVAFMALTTDKPQQVEVSMGLGSVTVQTAQWMVDLARSMNMAMAKVALYDDRFTPTSQQIFHNELDSGDLVYDFKPAADWKPAAARVARLALRSLEAHSQSDGVLFQIQVQVDLPGFTHIYTCERTAPSNWDRDAFSCAGEKILGDPLLWKAATFVP